MLIADAKVKVLGNTLEQKPRVGKQSGLGVTHICHLVQLMFVELRVGLSKEAEPSPPLNDLVVFNLMFWCQEIDFNMNRSTTNSLQNLISR